jgi:ABC-type spermidine/putrescine transport system permease subunit I
VTDALAPLAVAKEVTHRPENAGKWLIIPPLFLVAVVFFVPAIYLVRMSLNVHVPGVGYATGWTFDNYVRLVTSQVYLTSLLQTFLLAVGTASVVTLLSYLFALWLWLARGRTKLIFLAIALCPLLISEISIVFGWWMFFPRNGLLSIALIEAGFTDQKTNLLYTVTAAVVGLTYISLPYSTFILLSVFDGIDRRTLDASADLNASPMRTFVEVLLPLTANGVVAAFSQAFVWSMGIYVTPVALGPDWLWTIGQQTYEQTVTMRNWPMASVLAVVVVLLVLVAIYLTRRLNSPTAHFHA